MTTTPLGFTHLTSNANQPEDPVNAMVDGVENSIHAREVYTISGDKTLTAAEFRSNFWHVLNAAGGLEGSPTEPSVTWFLTVPALVKTFGAENNTSQPCIIQSAGAGSPDVSARLDPGEAGIYQTDAVDVHEIATLGYDIGLFASGTITDSATLYAQFVAVRDFTVPRYAPGSQAFAGSAPSDVASDFSLRRNGVEFGTVRFDPGAASPSIGAFTVAARQAFSIGDRLELVGPSGSPSDTTLGDCSITLRCARGRLGGTLA